MKNKFNSATFLASICLPGLLLLGPFSSAQQPIPGSTLKDFFDAAIKYSPELRISAENLNISTARKDAAQGRLLPQVSAGANVSDNRLNQLGQRQTFDGQRYYLGLTQTLFNWRQFAARKQAKFQENQAEEEYYHQLASILTDVADRYFDVLQIEDALESIISEEDALSNQRDQVQSLFDRQMAQITDLYQVQASLAAVQAEQLQLEAELAINQERLRSISGLAVGPLNKLATDVQIPPLSETQDYYVLKAQESNHLVQAQKYALRAAEEGISERRGAYMPEISLIAQRQDADVGFDNLPMNRRDNTYVGLNFSIPIYAGGSNRAGVSEAYSRRNIAESQLRVSQLEARELVRSAYLQIQASDAQTEAAKVLVESTILAAEAMEQGFSLGTVTSVDLLNALRDRFQAERELQRIRYDHIRYLLLLKRETGTLSAEDLVEIGEWLVQPDIE